jgi:hypothetical protein
LADRHSIEWTRPGEIINVNSVKDIGNTHQQLVLQDTGLQTFQEQLNYHARHAEETMALNPNAAGSLSTMKRSATEASQAMSGANARFNSMIKYIKWSGFDDMAHQYGQLMQQYIDVKNFPILNPENQVERDKIMSVTPDDIAGEMFYRIKDNTMTNKDVRQQLITNMLGVLAPYSQAMPNMDIAPLLKGLLEVSPIAGELNIDEIFSKMKMQTPDIMGQENRSLEKMGAEGQPGMAGGGAPANPATGVPPALQAVSEQYGRNGGLF